MSSGFPLFFDERVETMPRPQLRALQEVRLLRMIAYACERAPLIRETWAAAGLRPADIRSIQDFTALAPFIGKDEVRSYRDRHGDPCGGLKSVGDEELRGVTFTSGTTGDPTPVPRALRPKHELGIMRDMWMIGARPGEYTVLMRPTFRVGHIGPRYQDVGFKPILFSHSPDELPRLIEASLRFRPTTLFFLSSPLLIALEELFEQTGQDPREVFRSYRGALFGGEPLSPRLRALIQSWGLEIFEMGGLGESISMVSCTAHDGMHAWEDQVLVECLSVEDDRPVSDGEIGELVVTVLDDPYLPMIRYRTDDLVTVDRSPCRCGRTHARLKIMGRKSDRILVGDVAILPRQVHAAIEREHPSRAGLFQIIRPAIESRRLRVRVGYNPGLLDEPLESYRRRIMQGLGSALAVECEIEMVEESVLLKLGPPHKIPRVVNS